MTIQRKRLYSTRAIVALAGAAVIGPACAQDQNTPRGLLHVRVAGMAKVESEGAGSSPTLSNRMDLKLPSTYMVNGDPDQAVDLNEWSGALSTVGEMPLTWEPGIGRFRISERRLANIASDAQVWFTWNFLRAYAKLATDLRKSGSTLAVGMAALVAADVLYPENWACLPAETRDAAAIAALLRLYAPAGRTSLHDACVRENPADRRQLVRDAVDAMCRRRGEDAPAVESTGQLDWLDSAPLTSGAAHEPMKLARFLPRDREALERLVELVHKEVPNLTIRARIVAAALPQLYGPPGAGMPEKDEAARNWERHLTRLLEAQRSELLIRDEGINLKQARGAVIVPQFEAGDVPAIRLRSDPGVLEPLMYIAGHIAQHRLRAAKHDGAAQGFRAALKTVHPTSDVLTLAGVDPSVEFRPGNGTATEPAMTRLTWSKLERVTSRGDEGRDTESVHINLIDDRPTGQGRALGIGADNRLIVLEQGGRQTVRLAKNIKPGASVLGYVGTGQPTREESFLLRASVRAAWFRVLNRRFDTPKTVAVEIRLGNGSRFVFGDEHRVLLSFGESAAWRMAGNLRSDLELWDRPSKKGSQPNERPTIKELVAVHGPVPLVELSLSWNEERGRATNVVVLPPGEVDVDGADALAQGPALLAEARSMDSGPIAPESLIKTIPRASGEELDVRADQLSTSPIKPSVLAGFLHQGEDDAWREAPWLSQHTCRVIAREPVPVQEAFRLKFEGGGLLVLGPGNWVLVRKDLPKGEVAIQRSVDDLHAGDELVSGVDGHALRTLRLQGVERESVVPDKSPPYFLIRAENLSWAKVGGVLVSIEAKVKDDDAVAEGLAAATTTLALRSASGELQYRAIANVEDDGGAGDWHLAAVDPAIPKLLAEALIAGVHPRATSHTVRVEIGPAPLGENPPRSLECAPGQLLLILRQGGEGKDQAASRSFKVIPARSLLPGDELVEFGRGKGAVSSLPLVRLIDHFHEPPVSTLMLENRKPRYFEMNRAILANNGIAVVMSVAGEVGTRRGRGFESPQGEGRNSGTAPGPQVHAGRPAPDPDAALTATLRGGETEDVIHFPDNVKEGVLKPFGADLAAKFAAESPKLHPPLVAGSRLLKYWESKFADQPVDWRHRSSDVAAELRVWVDDLIRTRDHFLKKPRSSALPALLLREMVLASWLREAGAVQLSDQVLADLLELAIFTGCERGKESLRLGRDLRLPLLLYTPGFVRGEKVVRPTEPISLAARELVREWGGNGLIVEGGIHLSALYRAWRKAGERLGLSYISLPTYWEPFTANDENLKPDDAAAAARAGFGEMVSLQVHALVSEQQIAGSSP